jgi:hypothetical protein
MDSNKKEGVMGLVVLRMGRRARRLLLFAGVVFVALPAGSALADTTIGQTGGTGLCTTITPGALYADSGYVVPPSGGKITSFAFLSDPSNALEPLDFLVLRPQGSKYRVVGRTGAVTLDGLGLDTFPADISVTGGDILGFWFPSRLDNCYRAGTGPLFAKITASDPNTGDLIAVQPQGAFDLNESAHLVTPVGQPPPPTSKGQCEHGGWKSFGTMFKNQGDCVSYVATGGKNPPSWEPHRRRRKPHEAPFRRGLVTL